MGNVMEKCGREPETSSPSGRIDRKKGLRRGWSSRGKRALNSGKDRYFRTARP